MSLSVKDAFMHHIMNALTHVGYLSLVGLHWTIHVFLLSMPSFPTPVSTDNREFAIFCKVTNV